MIPRVAKMGTSFAGAGLYYLHDKRASKADGEARTVSLSGPQEQLRSERPAAEDYMLHDKGGARTAHRVGFTATRNLPVTSPQKALRCMSWVASHSQQIRQAAVAAAAKAEGMSYADYVREKNPFRGRKGSQPVYTLSIAWRPTKNKTPDKQDMLKAADEVLQVLGLEDRQALVVEHTDTKHPHIHLIVNRVSPVNGKYANVSNDYLKLSQWAMEYERRTGLVLCHERIFNWRKRNEQRLKKEEARKADPKARGRYVRGKSAPRRDRDWYKRHEHLSPDELRRARARRQQKELDQFSLKQAAALLKLDERLKRTLGGQQRQLLDEIEKKREEIAARQGGGNLKDKVRDIFRKAVDNITLQAFLRNRSIKAMQKSADGLGDLMEKWRREKRDQLARQWASMEQRHAKERERDEQRIARKESKGRSEATGARGKKQFNIRGDADSARHTAAKPPVSSLANEHRKTTQTRPKAKAVKQAHGQAAKIRPARAGKTASSNKDQGIFSVLAIALSHVAGIAKAASKQADGGMKKLEPTSPGKVLRDEPVSREEGLAEKTAEPDNITIMKPSSPPEQTSKQATSPQPQPETQPSRHENQTRSGLGKDAEYQSRVTRRLEKLEEKDKKKKRKRRKRKRPRGRRRKIE